MIILLDAPSASLKPVSPNRHAAPAAWRPESESPGGDRGEGVAHHGHGGGIGPLGQALRSTLGQLGLAGTPGTADPPPAGTTTTITATLTITVTTGATATSQTQAGDPASTPAQTPPASSGSAAPASASSKDLRGDFHALMHALFQAVRGQRSTGGDLGSALGSLATQAGQGTAPPALQQAFDALVTDVLGAPDAASSDASSATRPTLQQFLQALRQNLGFGDEGSPATSTQVEPTGNLLSVQA